MAIDETLTLSLVILRPITPHSGKITAAPAATEAVTDRTHALPRRIAELDVYVAPLQSARTTGADGRSELFDRRRMGIQFCCS
jgi:hypothetical protein